MYIAFMGHTSERGYARALLTPSKLEGLEYNCLTRLDMVCIGISFNKATWFRDHKALWPSISGSQRALRVIINSWSGSAAYHT